MAAAVIARVERCILRFSHPVAKCDDGRMSTYILWDIDGTLVCNTPNGGALYLDAIEQVTGTRPTESVSDPHGMTEGQLLAAILEVNGLHSSRLGEVLYQLDVLSREQHERGHVRDACVGVEAAIDAMTNRGWTNALLTGNGPNRARYKLLAAGIDPELFDWDHSYFGHQSPTRHHLTAGARAALDGHDSVIIGDTPNDGLAADSAGIPFIAVATGIYPAEVLKTTSALVVADDMESGLDDVLDAIESATTRESPEVAPSDELLHESEGGVEHPPTS
jgi:phosphoglycolate phosphatase